MKNLSLLLTIAFLSTLAGCTYYRVNADEIAFSSVHPKQNEKEIRYLETVNVPYEVIGTVVVATERRNSIEEVVEKMKSQIAILGGDAVTNIVQYDEPSPITRIRTRYKGTVIIFTNSDNNHSSAIDETPSEPAGENLK